jgi:hypothetical protein
MYNLSNIKSKMGNSLNPQQIQERTYIIDNINKLNFNILDIGDKNGLTGYLDFFHPSDLKDELNIMKGQDIEGRKFFVFKSIFDFEDGSVYENFTSFFQRYADNDLLWHCCGHYGPYIMNTEGGTTNEQFKFIFELFKNNYVQLDKEKCYDLRLNFYTPEGFKEPGKYPIRVKIGCVSNN